jgi:hypothetical protein
MSSTVGRLSWEVAIIVINATSLITTKTDTNVRHRVMIFANSAQSLNIHKLRKIKFTAKTVTDTVLIKTASTIIVMFARKFINVKTVIRLN